MENTEVLIGTKWAIDPAHTEIGFRVKHLMITNVKGVFTKFQAGICSTGDDFEDTVIDFSMDPSSINTGDEKRDAHLRSADFFDAEKYPEITFKSSSMKKTGKGNFELLGDLTMKGITHPVKLAAELNGMVKDPWGGQRAGFTLNGKINRKKWDLNWNVALEAGGVMVSEEVQIVADVQLKKQ